MAGKGPEPKVERTRRPAPVRGEWQSAPGAGWQYGPVPKPPTGLLKATREAWAVWLGAWFASYWTPDDLPGLRQVIRLYDQVEREPKNAALHTQLRMMLDTYGISPKGQQDRRWKRPEQPASEIGAKPVSKYGHLRAVVDGEG